MYIRAYMNVPQLYILRCNVMCAERASYLCSVLLDIQYHRGGAASPDGLPGVRGHSLRDVLSAGV